MQLALQPYVTAGIAIAGASLIAVPPVAVPLPGVANVQAPAIQLTGAWEDAFNAGSANLSQLVNNYGLAPGVGFQQSLVNMVGFMQLLINNDTNVTAVAEQMQDNIKTVFSSWDLLNADDATKAATTAFTIASDHNLLLGQLPGFLPPDIDAGMVNSILDFMSSPLSGVIMGALGPSIAPWVALSNSISDGDSFTEIIANMVGAYFNGATLNLNFLLPAINDAGLLPAPMQIDNLEFAFGGLLTGGEVAHAPWKVFDSTGAVAASVPVVGGSMINSLGINILGVPVLGSLGFEGHAVGPIGAWLSFSELTAQLLGAGWNEAGDGKGAPTSPVLPPWAGVQFPTVPDDYFGGAGAGEATDFAGTDLWTQVSDAIAGFQWSDLF
ncbi:outer membrane porin GjpA [[Mycobacterium] crassicus]|uniref:Outer membrane porin GjpA n=1 Tax=[Mycobacterium] crassicus TaxID=2872309 RepID=A0ABU5XDA9_9MYCO|nr:outer membrane porin GjpA [Mycolicibacter sp. MYC098]MEB3019767.1 outer membrane porin GjpA [Mycolicibacter sp. MYC098]